MDTKLSLRLLIDTKSNKVVFAEAGKGVVDFLFSLLAMPIGSFIKLIGSKSHSMAGGIAKVYKSLQDMDNTYLQPNQKKDSFLDPLIPSTTAQSELLLPAPASASTAPKIYYQCSNRSYAGCTKHFSEIYGSRCPSCSNSMNTRMQFVNGNLVQISGSSLLQQEVEGGIVKGVVTYTIADDLTVTPMSTISNIFILNKFNIKDFSTLKDKTVSLGLEEGLKLLWASLHSTTVHTDVFLRGKEQNQIKQKVASELFAVDKISVLRHAGQHFAGY